MSPGRLEADEVDRLHEAMQNVSLTDRQTMTILRYANRVPLLFQAGACAMTCTGGTTNCSGACVDTQTDSQNCGACGLACQEGTVCSAGVCGQGCSGGAALCSGACVDIATDPMNCGACNNVCDAGQVCSSGTCSIVCGPGQQDRPAPVAPLKRATNPV